MKESLVKEKAFYFALKAIDLYKSLLAVNEYVLSKQFIRSATSIGANINEALTAYSKKEFAAKMSIASKEARETVYWLELLQYSKFINYNYQQLLTDINELIKMLTAIVKTTQSQLNTKNS